MKLIKGHKYQLKASLKSSVERTIRVIMQGGESLNWPVYSSNNEPTVGNAFVQLEDVFTMEADTDAAAFLSICLGDLGDGDYKTTQHVVVIDDISLVDLTAGAGDDEQNLYEEKELSSKDISVALSATSFVYTGSKNTPKVTVKDKSVVLVEGKDYELSYKDNVNAGKATVTVKGLGRIKGEITKEFTIAPVSSLTRQSIRLLRT